MKKSEIGSIFWDFTLYYLLCCTMYLVEQTGVFSNGDFLYISSCCVTIQLMCQTNINQNSKICIINGASLSLSLSQITQFLPENLPHLNAK